MFLPPLANLAYELLPLPFFQVPLFHPRSALLQEVNKSLLQGTNSFPIGFWMKYYMQIAC